MELPVPIWGRWVMDERYKLLRNSAWFVRNYRWAGCDQNEAVAKLFLAVRLLLEAGEPAESVVPPLVDLFLRRSTMSDNEKLEKKPGTPKRLKRQFRRFVDEVLEVGDVVDLAVAGILVLKGMPRVVDDLAKVVEDKARAEHALKIAKKQAALAERESNRGFPLLYGQATVAVWSLLEALVQSVAVSILRNDEKAIKSEAISRLRVKVGEYESLSDGEKAGYIISLLEAETSAGLKNGVERFEVLLKPFGLDGDVPKRLRRDLFEFGQVRNALVHQGGRSDRRLNESCPWLGLDAGENVYVSREMFYRYATASISYTSILVCRSGMAYGIDMSADLKEAFDGYAEGDC